MKSCKKTGNMRWLEHSVGEPKNPSTHCLPARLQRKRDLSEKQAAALPQTLSRLSHFLCKGSAPEQFEPAAASRILGAFVCMARRTEAKWQTPYFLTLSCGRQTAPESTCVGSFGQCSFVVAGLGTEAEKELGKVGTKPSKNSFSTKVSQREQLGIQDSSGRLLVAPPSPERSEAVASGFSPTCTSYQHITCAECLAICMVARALLS